jgi:acyl-[acyl-carrier-protein]-phospholipid O-acyltransferase/long-chain-fatty-acid--[acyl-carrier-protein] ligase
MLGYLRVSAPGVLERPDAGWYDTGDIVSVGAGGFVTVTGRLGRFAKIAGEMVSMAAAEDLVSALWPKATHAVISRPDGRKGERLMLVTTHEGADMALLLTDARSRGVPELMVPRHVMKVGRLPLLGSGKVDYPAVARLVEAAERDAA